MKRFIAVAISAIVLLSASPAAAQQSAAAIHKLAFMQGTWRCVKHGPANYPPVYFLSYSFSPDGNWMEERAVGKSAASAKDWEVQMWGYDAARKKLVAYRFTAGGAATKTVSGWQNGEFVSRRDDNGVTISIRQHSRRAFDWIVQSADKSATTVDACTR